MAIGPEQRAYMQKTLMSAIARFYGEAVPSLKDFSARKRATFLAKLEELVDATGWRKQLDDQRAVVGTARGVVTRLNNEKQSKIVELRALHAKELADLQAEQQAALNKLAAHYEPSILAADEKKNEEERQLTALERKAFFHALGIEDDSRQVYRGDSLDIDKALQMRLTDYTESNLMADADGAAVQQRVAEEGIISDIVYLAKDVPTLRTSILSFIANGKLPAITVTAWEIEAGKDIHVEVG